MESAESEPVHPVLVTKAMNILRAKHERPEWVTWAAEVAGHIHLAEVEELHAAPGVPPVESGLMRSNWCDRCNEQRPCGPLLRALRLARIGGHLRRPESGGGTR